MLAQTSNCCDTSAVLVSQARQSIFGPTTRRWASGIFDLQRLTDGRLDASILRQLLIALAMIGIMLARPRGLWPAPEYGRSATPGAVTSR